MELHAPIIPDRSKYEVLSTKVEIKLVKVEPKQWVSLDTAGQQLAVGAAVPVAAPPPAPYAGYASWPCGQVPLRWHSGGLSLYGSLMGSCHLSRLQLMLDFSSKWL